jgi:hypothetical protein
MTAPGPTRTYRDTAVWTASSGEADLEQPEGGVHSDNESGAVSIAMRVKPAEVKLYS